MDSNWLSRLLWGGLYAVLSLHLVLNLLPGAVLAGLLGLFPGTELLSRFLRKPPVRGLRASARAYGTPLAGAAVLWDLLAFGLAVWLGGVWGFFRYGADPARLYGGGAGVLGYLLGRGLAALKQRTQ